MLSTMEPTRDSRSLEPWLAELASALPPDRLSRREADLAAASHDESSLPASMPAAVAWPVSTEETSRVVEIAARHRVPLTARGAGTSLEGNPIPILGGLVVDFSRMDRVLEVRAADLAVRVEPGVVYERLNEALRPHGLFFPPSPGGSSDSATIGGMLANDASGIYSVKYGGTRDSVLAATVVLGDGRVVRLGSDCRKTSSGYHLIGLVVGSEGTLGLVTDITLRLRGVAAAERQLALVFPDERRAADAIAAMMAYGIDLAAVELLDRRTIAAINRFRDDALEERPTLFLEAHGSPASAEEAARAALEISIEHEGRAIELAGGRSPWEIRHYATRSIRALDPEAAIVRTDLAVPISRLPEVIDTSYRLADEAGLALFAFGHAGLGIVHVLIAERRANEARWRAAEGVKDAILRFVLTIGGTVSGEHGLGLGNRQYATLEHGAAVELMRGVKRVFDPHGILNPGKIWS